jgi:hypothetical protein
MCCPSPGKCCCLIFLLVIVFLFIGGSILSAIVQKEFDHLKATVKTTTGLEWPKSFSTPKRLVEGPPKDEVLSFFLEYGVRPIVETVVPLLVAQEDSKEDNKVSEPL